MAQTIAFLIGNDGPNISPATVVTFGGLEQLSIVSVLDSNGSPMTNFNTDTVTWTVGELEVGETIEINITATNNTPDDIVVIANITGRLRDPNQQNNQIEWTFTSEA